MSRKYNLVPAIENVTTTTVDASIGTAKNFTIAADTVMIEVQAKNGAICIRKGGTAGLTTGTFQYKVPDGGTRHFPVNSGAPVTYSIIGETASTELTLMEFNKM